MEENNSLNETYQNAKNELQSVISQLEAQLNEKKATEETFKSEIESLKAQAAEKFALETRIKELEELLVNVETQLKEEVLLLQLCKISITKLQGKQLERIYSQIEKPF